MKVYLCRMISHSALSEEINERGYNATAKFSH
jgi:hypothetical protein